MPKALSKSGEMAFSTYAPKEWKGLPATVRFTPTLVSFKTKQNNFLFTGAFSEKNTAIIQFACMYVRMYFYVYMYIDVLVYLHFAVLCLMSYVNTWTCMRWCWTNTFSVRVLNVKIRKRYMEIKTKQMKQQKKAQQRKASMNPETQCVLFFFGVSFNFPLNFRDLK